MAMKGIKDWILGSDLEEDNKSSRVSGGSVAAVNDFDMDASIFSTTSNRTHAHASDDYVQAFENKSSQMVVFEPRSYSESQGIADHLKSGRGCIVNLHRVSKEPAKRIIDFLSGVVYAIEGEVQKIGKNVFLTTPSNFGVYGEVTGEDENSQ